MGDSLREKVARYLADATTQDQVLDRVLELMARENDNAFFHNGRQSPIERAAELRYQIVTRTTL